MIFLRWLFNALVLLIVSNLVPGISFAGTWSLLIAVLVLSLVNALIRPLLILLTLPLNILTLGLFTLVINGLMFSLTASIVKGFEIQDFASAFWGALVYSLIMMAVNYFQKDELKAKVIK